MADWFVHPSMDPDDLPDLLRWLYDGYGGNLSEQARNLLLDALADLGEYPSAVHVGLHHKETPQWD